jgi:hypothetical protein
MANKGIIYCLKCPIKNDIKYIGKTTQKLEQRFNEKNLPYSFIRNVIVVKKYNILKNE